MSSVLDQAIRLRTAKQRCVICENTKGLRVLCGPYSSDRYAHWLRALRLSGGKPLYAITYVRKAP